METFLYSEHLKLNAHIVPFAGWQMPLSYSSIHEEHAAVRTKVGLFDISHMGVIDLEGESTLPFLNHLSSRDLLDKAFGKAHYTVFSDQDGTPLDDLLVYLKNEKSAFLIVNAGNREQILRHLLKEAPHYQVTVKERFSDLGIFSLQGPESVNLLQQFFPIESLEHMEFMTANGVILSRTGYTGEKFGYEIVAPYNQLKPLWLELIQKGAIPCGLGARDLLRLEMGYALYGHELSKEITAIESVANWTVNFNHDFIGREALVKKTQSASRKYPLALVGTEKIPARENYSLLLNNQPIGKVTSGTFSPSLQKSIALAWSDKPIDLNTEIMVPIREKLYRFTTTKLPFYRRAHD